MRRSALFLAAALLGAGSPAIAQPMEHGHHHEGEALFRGLSLSDTQRTQMRQIEQAGWAHARPIMEQMHAVHEQIATRMLAAGSVSQADLAPLIRQEEGFHAQLDALRLGSMLQARALLTPDQLAEAATKHTQMEALQTQERQLMQPATAE